MRNETIEIGSKWQHFKGDVMTIMMIVKHTETKEDMIVYEHQGETWCRPISSFLSSEDLSSRPDNKTGQKYRFIKLTSDKRD